MENIFAKRLSAARRMAGLSLQSLADQLGNIVTKQSLNKYEQGIMRPDSELVIALSNALKVSVNYFYTEPSIDIQFANVDFRKYISKLSPIQEISVEEKSKEVFERYFELEDILNFKEDSQYFKYDELIEKPEDAEEAAIELRKQWDLGYDPIPGVVGMLEDKGYKVIEIEAPDSFDGFKADIGNRKVIVLRKTKPEDDIVRKRFTALHELAHHALKFSEGISDKDKEKLCHSFASAVLYPADMARKEMHKDRFHFYQNELLLIKERWGISFSATFSRALKLGIINDYVYKKFNIGYRKRNYHKPNQEPGRYPGSEKPVRMERLVYLGLAKEVITINEAAYFAGISSWELQAKMNQMV